MALYYIGDVAYDANYLEHFGIKGMKWGVRRYQNPDGTLTEAGKKRYSRSPDHLGYQPLRGKKGDEVQQHIGEHTIRMERKARKAEEKADRYGEKAKYDKELRNLDRSEHESVRKQGLEKTGEDIGEYKEPAYYQKWIQKDTAKQKAYVEKAKQYLKSAEMDRAMQKAYSKLAIGDIETIRRLVTEAQKGDRWYVERYLLGQSGYNLEDYKRASKGKPAYQRKND